MSDPVLDLLNSKHIVFISSGRDYLINCLNPEHEDTHPSCRVDKVTGLTHCFSCGFKANIFKHFGLVTANTSIKIAKLKDKLNDLKLSTSGLSYPEGYSPITTSSRGISVETYRTFGAFTCFPVPELADRICFPIKNLRENIVVFQARHMLSDARPKYINYPKGAELPIYPVKYPGKYSSAILVEGIYDMLNLYEKGLKNVSCVFGTSTLFKNTALKLLPLKSQGITHIYILFDGDDAGRDGAEKLLPLIQEQDFVVEILKVPDGLDPGGMDQDHVNSIKDYIRP